MSEKFSPEEWQERFNEAARAAQRAYCDMLEFWRGCEHRPCRRTKACGGDDALACLKRNIAHVPYATGNRACDRLIAQTPEDADGPTKTARRFSPHDFACW